MKTTILNRIKALGGNIELVSGGSLQNDLQVIEFNTVLYPKPKDTPWAKADEEEPIYGLGEFIDANKDLFQSDKDAFYDKIINQFYQLTEEPHGQMVWEPNLFTPLTEGTEDYKEWSNEFLDDEFVNFTEIKKLAGDNKIEFVQLGYSFGFPDHIYVCSTDNNPENPTVFGTDHGTFFSEIDLLGTLEEYFNSFMTKEELITIVKSKME